MSNLHSFTSDKTLITHDGTVVWSEPVTGRHSLDFSTVSDSTLTDSMNETYATAVEDNETQYLSILETTNDITLEDLHNLTLENPKIQMQEILEYNSENVVENVDANTIDVGNQQVVVFSVDGSDELFGIQFAQDEEGNLQKYQFKFRTTENGQLEAIPDSIELLANDEAENQNLANVNEVLVQEIESHETEVTETPVFFTEDGRDPGIQETHVYIQQGEETVEEYEELRQDDQNVNIYIKGEQGSEPHTDEDCDFDENQEDYDGQQELHYEETEEVPEEQHFEEETVDIKAGILEESLAVQNSSANIKQELLQEDSQEPAAYSEESQDYHPYENHQEIAQGQYEENTMSDANAEEVNIQHDVQGEDYTTIEIEGVHESVLQYQQYISEDDQHIYEDAVTTEGQDLQEGPQHYEQLFIQETQVPVEEMSTEVEAREEDDEHSIDEQFVTETGTENDSDNDDYQIVEGLHITAEGDISEEALPSITGEPETVLQEVVEKPASVVERANILKQTSLLRPMREIRPKGNNNNKTIVYYVVPHVEKENVNSMPVNNTSAAYRQNRSIPRTVLKNSYADYGQDPVRGLVDERMNKRFARSKEAVQARLFNNFISKTTIPHAPVRQTRLPRKQQIKPVDARRNEEIIVQEVMVSSKGFIENVEERLRNKDKLEK
ncbi:hypothetical protein NQ318_014741 [Aromia moschata]|uniref:Uncharacterized protein n=1 Tax=Aromia moschata TaxID=1265417 RepID=A0AAV8ZDT1_9CUCU|nr:hypothetical protein NQ318_014741 [Aromia moschata]